MALSGKTKLHRSRGPNPLPIISNVGDPLLRKDNRCSICGANYFDIEMAGYGLPKTIKGLLGKALIDKTAGIGILNKIYQ